MQASSSLAQDTVVSNLVLVARATSPPACIGLYGHWGTGKTAILRSTANQWNERGLGPVVWFNSWEHDRAGDSLTPLLSTIATYASEFAKDNQKVKDLGTAVIKTALSLTLRLGISAATFAALGSAAVALSPLSRVRAEEYSDYFKARDDEAAHTMAASALKAQFADLVSAAMDNYPDGEQKLLILLDDVDRCLPDRALALIESVKLLLCGAPNCRALFLFAVDRSMINEAVRARYPGSIAYIGEDYLEKVFDFSFEAPNIVQANIEAYVRQLYGDGIQAPWTPQNQRIDLGTLTRVLSFAGLSTPRTIKRTLNRLSLLLPSLAEQGLPPAGDEEHGQFLAFVAGAERFRQLREFVFECTESEFRNTVGATVGHFSPSSLAPAAAELVRLPGIRKFLMVVGAAGASTSDEEAHRCIQKLGHWDLMLRRVGL